MSTAKSEHFTPCGSELAIEWTRPALALPESVRDELSSRLNRLHQYFPEMKLRVKIGITRSYEGLAFQSDEGSTLLRLQVQKNRAGTWKYPTYWTLAHELMHLSQFNAAGIPGTERATDIYALARLPPELIDEPPSYLTVPKELSEAWTREHSRIAHQLALEALKRRSNGLRRYAKWWEAEFERASGTVFRDEHERLNNGSASSLNPLDQPERTPPQQTFSVSRHKSPGKAENR